MNTILLTTIECRKEQQKQKRACKQRALFVPLRNCGKLRWCWIGMMDLAVD